MREKRNAYRLLVGKPEGKRPLGRPRRRWVDIGMDLGEVGWDDVDWIGLAKDRNRWRALVNLTSLHFIVNFTVIILSSSSLCFNFIFASDIFVLTSLTTAIANILAQIQRIR
jgi:hypothetical protein